MPKINHRILRKYNMLHISPVNRMGQFVPVQYLIEILSHLENHGAFAGETGGMAGTGVASCVGIVVSLLLSKSFFSAST